MDSSRGTNPKDCLASDAQWLRNLAARLIGDAALADDACQEAWLAAGRQGVASEAQRRPMLFRVMRRYAWRWRRAEARRLAWEAQWAPTEALPSTEELLSRGEQRRILWRRLTELDEPYRTVLLLRFQEGLETKAIAVRSQSPEDTVRRRIRRGLQLLRERYRLDDNGRTGIASLAIAALPLGSPSTSAAASAAAIATPPVAVLVGAWMMKKSLLTAGLLVAAVLVGGVAWSLREAPAPTSLAGAKVEVAAVPVSRSSAQVAVDPVAAERSDATASVSMDSLAAPPQACRVVGIVVDQAGMPLAGARIQLLYGATHWAAVPDWQCEVRAGFDGSFEVQSNGLQKDEQIRMVVSMSPLHQKVALSFGGGPRHDFGALEIAQVDVGKVVVGAASAAEGRLVDLRGAPIAQAWIDTAYSAQFTRSDRDGRFRLTHLKPGRSKLTFQSAGFLERDEEHRLPAGEVVDLGEIVLGDAPRISGVVTDLDGKVLLDAKVSTHGFTRGWLSETQGGRFDVPLPTAEAGRVIARADGYRQSKGMRVAAGQQDIVIRLAPRAPRGLFVVVDAVSGEAVTRFGLRIRKGAGSKAGDEKPTPVYGSPQIRTFRKGRAAAAGRVGVDRVEVVALGFRPHGVDVVAAAFGERGQRIQLQPSPGLRGRIVDEHGVGVASQSVVLMFGKLSRVTAADSDKPVPYLKDSDFGHVFGKQGSFSMYPFVAVHEPLPPFVVSASADTREHKAYTDAQGRFHFPVTRGAGRLLASDARGRTLASELFLSGADGRDLGDLPLVAPARLRGRLVPSIAVDLGGSIVTLKSAPGHIATVAADGTFEMSGLPPGEHWFSIEVGKHISAPRLWVRSWFVRLQAGKEHQIEAPVTVQAACQLQALLRVNGKDARGGSIDFRIDGGRDRVGELALGPDGRGVGTVQAGVSLRVSCEIDGIIVRLPDSMVLPTGSFEHTFEVQTAALEIWLPKTLALPGEGVLRIRWTRPNGATGKPLSLSVRDRERILGSTVAGDLRVLFPHVPVGATDCVMELKRGRPYSSSPWTQVGAFEEEAKPGSSHRIVLH